MSAKLDLYARPDLPVRPRKGKGSPYSTAERGVPETIPVLDSQPAGDESHKPGGFEASNALCTL